MSLDNVLEQIRIEAKTQAANIIKEGREQSEHIINEGKKDARKIIEKKEKELEPHIKKLKEIRLSKTRITYKRKRMEIEKEIINMCWEKAKERVGLLDPDLNEELINKILHIVRATPVFSIRSIMARKDKDTETKRPFYIYSNEKDAQLVKRLSDLEYAGSITCLGGIIAEAEDRKCRVNLTYDQILKDIYEISLIKIYNVLSGDAQDG